MPTQNTPIFKYPYPDEDTSNDYPTHLAALALAIETEQAQSGSLEHRPPAGLRGRRYFATARNHPTTGAVKPWNVLYYDDGTAWHALNKGAWLDFSWSWAVAGSPPFALSLIQDSRTVNRYRYDDYECTYVVNQLVQLTGTDAAAFVTVTLPIPALDDTTVTVQAQNEVCKGFIDSSLQVLEFYPSLFLNATKWAANGSPYWFRANVTYRIA